MFRLFRLPLLSLLVISVLCTACQKGHDMDDMAMDSAYMNIMMDMMTQMDAQGKTQDPDHDYAAQMVLHHEAAILMAEEQLRTGTNQEMKTTAQAIITKQRAEIAQFNAFLNGHQPMPPLVSQFNQLQKTNMDKMMAASDARSMTGKPDVDFAQLMVDHHQAAIDNSEALLQYGRNSTTRALAQAIIADQRQEIAALQNWLTRNR
ncbi:DUF305 domain-containing protein [Hymenobacter sp. BT188]|uniref:DUF305 domain-containing protein n=1 Tax=unclassified Hymenobacter TaxID=2615202 RepID=UPI00140BC78A|nr:MULTISPECIES: DUF305 domain-containing protein [unclassified Hymenobacter]MBC6609196.1 DUF305 domain-containing protein [Hymenobacter sp. BT188]QIL78210.1 DUF305 domain-containing protein [Hymenobacter sp. HDW8]